MKRMQYGKSAIQIKCNMKRMHNEKSASRGKCNTEKTKQK